MEPEFVLPYTVRRSIAAQAMPLGGSEFFRFETIVSNFPWRGFAVALVLFGGWFLAAGKLTWPWLESAWIGVLLLGLAACFSELAFRRDRLTAEGLERRSGLLGRKRMFVPYRKVERVTVEPPGRDSALDVGTVTIRLSEDAIRLVGITSPTDVATIIERFRLKERLE